MTHDTGHRTHTIRWEPFEYLVVVWPLGLEGHAVVLDVLVQVQRRAGAQHIHIATASHREWRQYRMSMALCEERAK